MYIPAIAILSRLRLRVGVIVLNLNEPVSSGPRAARVLGLGILDATLHGAILNTGLAAAKNTVDVIATWHATFLTLGAHARGLQYSFCLSVCLCVCFPYSGTSRNQAYKQQ